MSDVGKGEQMMEIGRPYSRLIRRLEATSTLSMQDRQRIAELPMTVRSLNSHQHIAVEGDHPTHSVLVLDGFLYRHKMANATRRQIVSFHVPGDIPDLHSLHIGRIDHNLSALGTAVVAYLPHASLRPLLNSSPGLVHALWRETLVDAAIFRAWVINLGQRDAIARVAHVVCELTLRLQAVDLARDLCIPIPWTQVDVSDACGISTVHANRVIQELRRMRLVAWDAKRVRILDWKGLVRIGDFSGDYLYLKAPKTGHRPFVRQADTTSHL
jgi:CRP-like cAMP-binding protein